MDERNSPYSRGGRGPRGAKERPSRVLFVRNINYATPESTIAEMFGKYGEIKHLFNLIDKRGMAFITYYDIRHADAAKLELQDADLGGRKIDVHYSIPKEDEIIRDEEDKNKGTLFITVRDATEEFDNEAVKKHFEQWGDVKEVRDCAGSSAQKFIECWDLRDASKIKNDQQDTPFAGGKLEIKYAFQSTSRERTGPSARSGRGGGRGQGYGRGAGGYGYDDGYQGGYNQSAMYNQNAGYAQAGYTQPAAYAQAGYAQAAYTQPAGYAQAGYARDGGYTQLGYGQAGYAQGNYAQGYDQGYGLMGLNTQYQGQLTYATQPQQTPGSNPVPSTYV